MTDTTPAEAEATADTIEFEHFDRKWSVPSKSRLSHKRSLEARYRATGSEDVAIVDTFLDSEQLIALEEIDPDDDQLDAFANAIAAAMGFKNAGN